jgi:hypothetical protein
MVNRVIIKLIIIAIIVAYSISAVLIIYGDIETVAASDFDESHFSALIKLNVIGIDSKISSILFLYTSH